MGYAISPILGVDLAGTTSTAKFALGTRAETSDGGVAVYVRAASEISTFAAVGFVAPNSVQMLTTTLAATVKKIGFAQTSIASAYYGWVHEDGNVKVNLAANCDDAVPLFTTATAGVLDDATVSAAFINGLLSTVTISNATAVTCIAGFPTITNYAQQA
jgi:hypothetical protein